MSNCTELILSNNSITNKSFKDLCRVLQNHPTIEIIHLGKNKLITSAKVILPLVALVTYQNQPLKGLLENNSVVSEIHLIGTKIPKKELITINKSLKSKKLLNVIEEIDLRKIDILLY